MWPCTVLRTFLSLMDTSCPNIPPPHPHLPQTKRPPHSRRPHPLRQPTTDTRKYWKTDLAPEQWMASREVQTHPMEMGVAPSSPNHTAVAALTITMNPETGASPDGKAKVGSMVIPIPWESRWPQIAGKAYFVAKPFTCLMLLPDNYLDFLCHILGPSTFLDQVTCSQVTA